jgi:hypothetical protein
VVRGVVGTVPTGAVLFIGRVLSLLKEHIDDLDRTPHFLQARTADAGNRAAC